MIVYSNFLKNTITYIIAEYVYNISMTGSVFLFYYSCFGMRPTQNDEYSFALV